MIYCAVLIAALLQDKPPLESLTSVAKHLDKGIEQFLAGKSAEEAFKPWKLQEPSAEQKAREELKKEGVTTARCFGMELRMYLYKDGSPVYLVNAFLHVNDKGASILQLRGRASDEKGGVPLDKLKGPSAPVADAGRTILAHALAGKPLPLADPDGIKERVPPKFRDTFVEGMKKSKEETEKVAAEIKELKPTEVRVILGDEQTFSTYGGDGKLKDAWLRGKLWLSEEGDVLFRFRATPIERR